MSRVRFASAFAALLATMPALAQPASPAPGAKEDEQVIVQGYRKAVTDILRERFSQSQSQLARFETKLCPMVIGMPTDWTANLTKIIRDNIVEFGGKLAEPGCTVNATVIFSDQPHEFIQAFAKKQPAYFVMNPRELEQFTAASRPVVSWHVTEVRSRDGQDMQGARKSTQSETLTVGGTSVTVSRDSPMSAKINRQSAATRLYTNVREDMLIAFVVVDRQQTPGKSMRQLADLATMHLLLDIKQDAGTRDSTSILSLFEPRPEGLEPPARMSQIDRGIVEGLYSLRENNRSASQQYSHIAETIRRNAGKRQE
jgi:hypothetical protein